MNRHHFIMLTAATVAVFVSGTARADVLGVPSEYSTIQAAIDASADGDEVVIADGVYTGAGNLNLDFGGRAITVRSENGPEACIIDCDDGDRARAFWFHSGESSTSVLRGISLINGIPPRGQAQFGGAILIEGASPTIVNCGMSDCSSFVRGGGVAVLSGAPLFEDCVFDQNFAEESNGHGGGGAYSEGEPKFVNCTFTRNFGGSFGGGIFSSAGTLELIDCTFTGNRSSSGDGAAVMAHDAFVAGCTFVDNRTTGGWGAGIRQGAGGLVVLDSVFAGNSSGEFGAGIKAGGQGSYTANCTFTDQWTGTVGAGFACAGAATHVIDDCIFHKGFSWPGGGGLAIQSRARVIVTNSAFTLNTAVPPSGVAGGVLVQGAAHLTLANCILWGNTPREAVIEEDGVLDISYSIVRGGWPGVGNIDADPLFVDMENGDLRLLPGSPAIDAGDNLGVAMDVFDLDGDGNTEEAVPFDLDGYGRFVDDPDTEDTGRCDDPCALGIVDMGAYEFGMAMGACCDAELGDCADDVPDEQCIGNGGRFEAETACGELDPPCAVAPPCIRKPEWICDGDVDGDGQVNPVDSGLVQAAFGSIDEQDLCNYDVDCDSQINPVDSGIVQSLFGTCAAPRAACP